VEARPAPVHHFAYGVLYDLRQRLRGLQLQFRRQIGFDTVDQYLRQLGKNRPDTLGRFLDQHLRGIHWHARTNRSNQACNIVLLAHRMNSELRAAMFDWSNALNGFSLADCGAWTVFSRVALVSDRLIPNKRPPRTV